MKFRLTTTNGLQHDEGVVRELVKYGFIMEPCDWNPGTYCCTGDGEIEISTLEELMQFAAKWGDLVLLHGGTIEIYDGYRE